MIVSILLLFLLIFISAAVLFFLFISLLPSLKAQKINAKDPLFSKEEVDAVLRYDDFKWAKTGSKTAVYTKEELISVLSGDEPQKQMSALGKNIGEKDFQFLKKCYKMLKGKEE
ncbi:MAG: hypothetical protein J6S81_00110 [Treponema sp.]|nr:hypothetical protein [Treponema sp.]